jgi:predicted lipoprotein with Yx(FWY)xxD motif
MAFLHNTRLIAVVLLTALVVAACGSSNKSAKTTGGSAAKSIVSSARKAKVGDVIVDGQGRTLYRFTAEAQDRRQRARPARPRGDRQA